MIRIEKAGVQWSRASEDLGSFLSTHIVAPNCGTQCLLLISLGTRHAHRAQTYADKTPICIKKNKFEKTHQGLGCSSAGSTLFNVHKPQLRFPALQMLCVRVS